jgi:hypothetical protein
MDVNGLYFKSRKQQEMFLFSETSKPALEPVHPPIQWVSGFLPGGKAAGA